MLLGVSYISTAKPAKSRRTRKAVATTTYNCENETIKVSYPTTGSAKITDAAGNTHSLKRAKSASGTRYANNEGIEFFTSGKSTTYTGPSGIENTCTI